MNYKDLDEIIKYYEDNSVYNKILAPNHLTASVYYSCLLGLPLFIVFILYILKFNINISNIVIYYIYSLMSTTLIVIIFFDKKSNSVINKSITDYKNNNGISISEQIEYDDIRFNNLYKYMLTNHKVYFDDNNFNILIPYIETKESKLQISPEYILRKTLLVSSFVSFLVALFSSIIPKFDINTIDKISLKSLEFLIISLIIIVFAYLILSSAIKFKTKKELARDKYNDLRSNLYKAKFRYDLEHTKKKLQGTHTNLNDSKATTQKFTTEKEYFRDHTKIILHKIVDILF